jgi:hypothetical protein
MAWVECEWATLIVFGNLKLAIQALKAYKAIERWIEMSNKDAILNALKHLGISLASVAGAAILGHLGSDNALLDLLTKAGVPGFVALALVPLLHGLFAGLQKKYLPGNSDENSQPSK